MASTIPGRRAELEPAPRRRHHSLAGHPIASAHGVRAFDVESSVRDALPGDDEELTSLLRRSRTWRCWW